MNDPTTPNSQAADLDREVLTREEQSRLTPERMLDLLKEGNVRFTRGEMVTRNLGEQVRQTAAGQHPGAIVLSCIDSRVPVETVFDRGIGDLFVARVAGNFVNTDILGSMEFACKVAGARLIVVMGHERCGAVMGAIDAVELGNITSMLESIRPAVESVSDAGGDRSSSNEEFVSQVARKNVELNLARIREESPILREMEEAGEIRIVGALYDIADGKVAFLPD